MNTHTSKNKVKSNGPQIRKGVAVDSLFLYWLWSERGFSLKMLEKWCWDFTPEDAEEVFSIMQFGYLKPRARRFRAMNRANLLHRLRQVKEDYRLQRATLKRGANCGHVSIDSIAASALKDDFSTNVWRTGEVFEEVGLLLEQAVPKLKGRKLIVVKAMLGWLRGGCLEESCFDRLTEDELKEFLPRNGESVLEEKEFIEDAFRRNLALVRSFLREERASGMGRSEG